MCIFGQTLFNLSAGNIESIGEYFRWAVFHLILLVCVNSNEKSAVTLIFVHFMKCFIPTSFCFKIFTDFKQFVMYFLKPSSCHFHWGLLKFLESWMYSFQQIQKDGYFSNVLSVPLISCLSGTPCIYLFQSSHDIMSNFSAFDFLHLLF